MKKMILIFTLVLFSVVITINADEDKNVRTSEIGSISIYTNPNSQTEHKICVLPKQGNICLLNASGECFESVNEITILTDSYEAKIMIYTHLLMAKKRGLKIRLTGLKDGLKLIVNGVDNDIYLISTDDQLQLYYNNAT